MFHKTSTKLAGLYLAIMMAISLFFSFNVYQLSVQEFERGIRRPGPAFEMPPNQNGIPSQLRTRLLQDREQQFQESKRRVIQRLVLINLTILAGGGFLSYYLARRTLKPIEEAHEAQSRFTADASHELRTPITAMRSENEVALMNSKLTLAQAKKQLQSNNEELEKLTQLSEGLLKLASLENGALNKEDSDVNEIINSAVSRALPLAEKNKTLISTNIPEDTKIFADKFSLSEALYLLLDNAVKYSPKKTEIKLNVTKEGKNIVFKVCDQGIGIKATEVQHIFERFYRADTARSKQNISGYGLGLALAKSIAEMHGGTLSAASEPGKGSVFTLLIPAKA